MGMPEHGPALRLAWESGGRDGVAAQCGTHVCTWQGAPPPNLQHWFSCKSIISIV